jgi:hypothetical protein
MADHPLPEWVDRRTAEWCAQICEAVAARLLLSGRRKGAEACATSIRALICVGKPSLPDIIQHREAESGDA